MVDGSSEFGCKLHHEMLRHNLTRADIAEMTNRSEQTVYRWLAWRQFPNRLTRAILGKKICGDRTFFLTEDEADFVARSAIYRFII